MSAVEAAITGAAVVGFLAGIFGTLFVLVVADTRRYGRLRRHNLDAARHGVRGGLYRVTAAPSSSTAVERKQARS